MKRMLFFIAVLLCVAGMISALAENDAKERTVLLEKGKTLLLTMEACEIKC